jgi:hypothetical protein
MHRPNIAIAARAPMTMPAMAPALREEDSTMSDCPKFAVPEVEAREDVVVVLELESVLVAELEVAVELVVAVNASCSSSGGGALNVVSVGSPQSRSPFSSVPQHCHNPVE